MGVGPRTTKLGRLLELSPSELLWLLRAVSWLALVRVAHASLALRTTQGLLRRLSSLLTFAASPMTVSRAVWAVDSTSWMVPGAGNCFVRAMSLQALLGQHGIRSELRVGFVQASGGGYEGHAWLELAGEVLIGETADLAAFRASSRVYPS